MADIKPQAINMIGRTKKKIATALGDKRKQEFKKFYDSSFFKSNKEGVPFAVVSMSGSKVLWDQVYSICSFYINAGRPLLWTIFSDGTYTREEIDLLQSIPFVRVNEIDTTTIPLDATLFQNHPLLKKLAAYSSIKIDRTTLFCDSDILFFPDFKNYTGCFANGNWYLPDNDRVYLDKEYLDKNIPCMFGVNSGFLVLNDPFNWNKTWEYIYDRVNKGLSIGHWSEQTAIHVVVTGSDNFFALDPRKFLAGGGDSFKLSVFWENLALRHFVGPVRHKMWQASWKKVLAV